MRRFAPVALIAISALAGYGQKRPITEKDIFAFHWIGDTQVSPDGSRAAFVETRVTANHEGYETAIYLLDLKTAGAQPVELLPGPHDGSPRWSPDGKAIAFVRAAVGPYKSQTQLTYGNDELFGKLDLHIPFEMQVKPTAHAGDIEGHTIDTFVQLPPEFDGSKKYPLILNIHGGPHSAYGWIFDHEMLWMAARGYVVVYPNPRGSTSYGQKFANVIQDNYPNDDFHDLMDTVDAVLNLGYVDPEKLGVTGGSGGGLLTDWTVTQTNRFKAAVAQRDIVDWANW